MRCPARSGDMVRSCHARLLPLHLQAFPPPPPPPPAGGDVPSGRFVLTADSPHRRKGSHRFAGAHRPQPAAVNRVHPAIPRQHSSVFRCSHDLIVGDTLLLHPISFFAASFFAGAPPKASEGAVHLIPPRHPAPPLRVCPSCPRLNRSNTPTRHDAQAAASCPRPLQHGPAVHMRAAEL